MIYLYHRNYLTKQNIEMRILLHFSSCVLYDYVLVCVYVHMHILQYILSPFHVSY